MAMTTAHLVEEILAYDLEPPSEDYSPHDFGREVGSQVGSDAARDIVRSCFEKLAGNIAESFLDGFLEAVSIESLDHLLLGSLTQAPDIGSGSATVRLLQRFCHLSNDEIAGRLLDRIAQARDGDPQNRLCFALWALICGETYDIPAGVVRRNTGIDAGNRIAEVMANCELTDYAKQTLQECLDGLADAASDAPNK